MTQSPSSTPVSETIITLISIWDEIGYEQEEKDEGLRKINTQIENVRGEFISKTLQRCQSMMSETEQIRAKHVRMLKSIGSQEDQINEVYEHGKKGTIKEKHDDVQSHFKEFLLIYKQRFEEFDNLQKQINKCFYSIGITNNDHKGEFAEIGEEDLTPARLRRYEIKSNQLNEEVDRRTIRFNGLKGEIVELIHDLEEEIPNDISDLINKRIYSDSVFGRLIEYISYLKDLTETRTKYISEMGVEITRLWDMLCVDEPTRRQFHASHTTLSQKNVQDCIDEADRLTKIRNDHLDEIIQRMKDDISYICGKLGYSKNQEDEIFARCESKRAKRSTQAEKGNSKNDHNDNSVDAKEEKEINDNEKQKDEEEENERSADVQDDNKNNNDEVHEGNNEDNNLNENENENTEENRKNDLDNDNEGDDVPKPDFDENPLIAIFNNYDTELVHLRKVQIVAQPIIDLINQRNEIIREFDELNDPNRNNDSDANKACQSETSEVVRIRRLDQLNGKGIPVKPRLRPPTDGKEKLRVEKITRRHKCVLPRIEKKLLIHLIQFREEDGEDFLWEGKPVIDELKHIQVSQSEINQNRTLKRKSSSSKKNPKISSEETTATSSNTDKSAPKQRKSMNAALTHKKLKPQAKNSKKNPRKSTVPTKPALIDVSEK